MIVLGADTHEYSYTIAAVTAVTDLIGQQFVQIGAKGVAALAVRARYPAPNGSPALEDCRHVSGSREQLLIEARAHGACTAK